MKKVIYTSFTAVGLLLSSITVMAQSVGIGTITPNSSAGLDITSTNKGLLIPRVNLSNSTDAVTISSPATSLLVYNTNATLGAGYYFNSGTPASPVWSRLLTAAGASGWGLTGNAGTDTAVNFLGTTTNMPMRFRINNRKYGQLSGQNVFLGDSSGVSTTETATDGIRNVAIGRKSFTLNQSGNYNMAIGSFALNGSITASENIAVGDAALSVVDYFDDDFPGSVNTAIGSSALQDLLDGGYNTAIGGYAMISNWDGSANTAIGTFSDCLDTTNQVDVFNATAIGFGALADVDDMVRIGDENVTQIGGAVDWSVLSDARFKKDIRTESKGLDFIMQLRPVNYHYNFKKMYDARLNQLKRVSAGSNDAKAKAAVKMLGLMSNVNYKQKVAKNEAALYNGLLAQEVETAANKVGYNFSGIVKPTKPNGRYALRYATFVVPLIEAVQEQQKTIEAQNVRIEALEKRLLKLEKR